MVVEEDDPEDLRDEHLLPPHVLELPGAEAPDAALEQPGVVLAGNDDREAGLPAQRADVGEGQPVGTEPLDAE